MMSPLDASTSILYWVKRLNFILISRRSKVIDDVQIWLKLKVKNEVLWKLQLYVQCGKLLTAKGMYILANDALSIGKFGLAAFPRDVQYKDSYSTEKKKSIIYYLSYLPNDRLWRNLYQLWKIGVLLA